MAERAAKTAMLVIDDLIVDREFQMREQPFTDADLEETREALKAAPGSMERIKVVEVKGTGLILTDGFRRVAAYKAEGHKSVPALVKPGSMLDATLEACRANRGQVALPLRAADKRRSIMQLLARLEDANQAWSDGKVAEQIGGHINLEMVRRCRIEFDAENADDEEDESPPDPHKIIGRDGKHYPSERRGKKRKQESPPEPKPDESLDKGWENVPLDEFLKAEDYVWEALKKHKITTAGELERRILAGEQFGLRKPECLDLLEEIKQMRSAEDSEGPPEPKPTPAPPKPQGATSGFPWREFESHMGYVIRGIDALAASFPNDDRCQEYGDAKVAYRNLHDVMERWKKRRTGDRS